MYFRLLSLFVVAAALPTVASAQSADAKYCSALSDKYQTYAQDNGGKSHNAPPAEVAAAMSKCSTDSASAIPVLEGALKAAKVTLPAR
jgi:hypothetical protein